MFILQYKTFNKLTRKNPVSFCYLPYLEEFFLYVCIKRLFTEDSQQTIFILFHFHSL